MFLLLVGSDTNPLTHHGEHTTKIARGRGGRGRATTHGRHRMTLEARRYDDGMWDEQSDQR